LYANNCKGVYEDGKIVLTEIAPVTERTEVIVTFLTEEKKGDPKGHRLDSLEGKIIVPDDFDEPLAEPTTGKPSTHLASESALSKDWLTPEEDKAWQYL